MNDQRSLRDQLKTLEELAGKHGLYDAQDWLREWLQLGARTAAANVDTSEDVGQGGETVVQPSLDEVDTGRTIDTPAGNRVL